MHMFLLYGVNRLDDLQLISPGTCMHAAEIVEAPHGAAHTQAVMAW
jgi:hypothetical protein